jgi:hypothetical protein
MRNRFTGLMLVPGLLSGLVAVWVSVKIAATNLPLGLFVMAFGGITMALMIRRILAYRGVEKRVVDVGELRGPEFDYLIWIAIGVPMFLVLALVILAITGALTSR